MKVVFNYDNTSNIIWLTADTISVQESVLKKTFFKMTLTRLLIDKTVNIITLSPQKYSLGHDLPMAEIEKTSISSFLINTIEHFTEDIGETLVSSEEFSRALLAIVVDSPSIHRELNEIAYLLQGKVSQGKSQVIFCENDGASLCICNPKVDVIEMQELIVFIADEMNIILEFQDNFDPH